LLKPELVVVFEVI